jgi:hypothetical protein
MRADDRQVQSPTSTMQKFQQKIAQIKSKSIKDFLSASAFSRLESITQNLPTSMQKPKMITTSKEINKGHI